jgi:hypothetical protein
MSKNAEYYASLPTDIFKRVFIHNYEVKLKDSNRFAYFLPSVRVAEGAISTVNLNKETLLKFLCTENGLLPNRENHFYNNTIDLFCI